MNTKLYFCLCCRYSDANGRFTTIDQSYFQQPSSFQQGAQPFDTDFQVVTPDTTKTDIIHSNEHFRNVDEEKTVLPVSSVTTTAISAPVASDSLATSLFDDSPIPFSTRNVISAPPNPLPYPLGIDSTNSEFYFDTRIVPNSTVQLQNEFIIVEDSTPFVITQTSTPTPVFETDKHNQNILKDDELSAPLASLDLEAPILLTKTVQLQNTFTSDKDSTPVVPTQASELTSSFKTDEKNYPHLKKDELENNEQITVNLSTRTVQEDFSLITDDNSTHAVASTSTSSPTKSTTIAATTTAVPTSAWILSTASK